jgi:hypothetical protein
VAIDITLAIPACSNPRARGQFFEQPEQPRRNPPKNNKVICSNFPGCSSQLARLLTCSCREFEQVGMWQLCSVTGQAKSLPRKAALGTFRPDPKTTAGVAHNLAEAANHALIECSVELSK